MAEGAIAYYLNYRLSYLIVRTMFRVIRDPRAFGILWGYFGSLRKPKFAARIGRSSNTCATSSD